MIIAHAADVEEDFSVRVGETKRCRVHLPDDLPTDRILEAAMPLRTWHGHDPSHQTEDGKAAISINGHAMQLKGKNHHYDYDVLSVAPEGLRAGENVFEMHR